MTREDCTQAIIDAKSKKGLTWEGIAKGIGRNVVWVTAALLGQASMSADEAVGSATTSSTSAVALSVPPASSAAAASARAASPGAARSRSMSAMLSSVRNPCTPSLQSRKRSWRANGWEA